MMRKFGQLEQELLDSLRSDILGKDVLVITCGPSMENWKAVYDGYPKDNKPVVFCVKQSVKFVGELCDVHVLNEVNLIKYKYKYKKDKPKVIFGLGAYEKRWFGFVNSDLVYTVKSSDTLSDSMAGNVVSHFNSEIFRQQFIFGPVVNWGPGIMYECVLPFLINCKPSTITTVGWDIADNNGINTHYMECKKNEANVNQINTNFFRKLKIDVANALLRNSISSKVHDLYRNLSLFIKYSIGLKVNQVTMIDGEAETVSKLIPHVKNLCKENGIQLNIVSKSSWTNN
ncbi:hypothetical protein EKG38_24145 [Shewanella canadensis]|uniref:DUF115 domain-containing protein n=1 Tax=Shewanella canadensis TaxID=271096 RepID=A0A431WKE0_9GAMM|nr:hypothetical protein [Shewanella canadensis]RTR35967.1 hypothetical protein EKG38_24145 [Shewanella canadensis]